MNNISHIKDCYGCGVCVIACPKKIISINLNETGFYAPCIDDVANCINCGICVSVCAFSHKELSQKEDNIRSYAAWSKDDIVRKRCSSGGVGFELGRTMISNGYKVCGVRYNINSHRAEHYIATNEEDLISSIGSKYIQSYTVDGFKSINRKEKYLVTGTPCQIDSIRRYIQKFHIEDNFLLLDFFCHGVPSMLVWKKYIKDVEKIVGTISYASWRNKTHGWHDSWAMEIDGEQKSKNGINEESYNSLVAERNCSYSSRLSQGDLFFKFFLGNMCLGKACYNDCKYKYNHSSADIRIGDLWGKTYADDEDGVSAVITFTTKGHEFFKMSNCATKEHPFDVVAEGQIKKCLREPRIRDKIIKLLQSDKSLSQISAYYDRYIFPINLLNLPKRIIRKFLKIIHYEK